MYLGIVYAYLPFMVLPLYAALVRLDPALLEAAADLGARPWRAFVTVTLPLSLPGVAAGFLLVFIPAVGRVRDPRAARRAGRAAGRPRALEGVLPEPRLAAGLGAGGRAAAAAGAPDPRCSSGCEGAAMSGGFAWLALALGCGLAFLYLPIAAAGAAIAFNDEPHAVSNGAASRSAGIAALLANERAASRPRCSRCGSRRSRRPSRWCSAALAGFALARFGASAAARCSARWSAAPLVMPEVVTGLSLLLLFVALAGADRLARRARRDDGRSRTPPSARPTSRWWCRRASPSVDREPGGGGDGPRRRGPGTVFRTVTLPLIAPALGAGWLLAFTLSLDDVVIASFVSGPAATTLPMLVFSQVRLGLTPEINALGDGDPGVGSGAFRSRCRLGAGPQAPRRAG